MAAQKQIGLSLSGGGYRAAAFHLGTLQKLQELNVLNKVDKMSTISGGSITGAYYCLNSQDYNAFEAFMKEAVTNRGIIKHVIFSWVVIRFILLVLLFLATSVFLLYTDYPWTSFLLIALMIFILIKYQFQLLPLSKVIENAYDKVFYKKAILDQLTSKPELAIGSTNLQTCRPFTFSKRKMGDSKYANMNPPILFNGAKFPLARAVMASSSVPFIFTPVIIDESFYEPIEGKQKVNPQLVDGGVYDNQGIQKLTQKDSSYECDIIITSDAGNKLPFEQSYNNTLILLIRTMDVFMARIKHFQLMKNVYQNASSSNNEIAYISLGWDLENCISGFIDNLKDKQITEAVINAQMIPEDWVKDVETNRQNIKALLEKNVDYNKIVANRLSEKELTIARGVGTNLTRLSKERVDCLMRHASNITEIQIKLYCPSLLN